MKTIDDKIDDAVHAAMKALGLDPEKCPDLADEINAHIYLVAMDYLDDSDESDEE